MVAKRTVILPDILILVKVNGFRVIVFLSSNLDWRKVGLHNYHHIDTTMTTCLLTDEKALGNIIGIVERGLVRVVILVDTNLLGRPTQEICEWQRQRMRR